MAGVVAVDFIHDVLLMRVRVSEAGGVDGAALVEMAGDWGGLGLVGSFDVFGGCGSHAFGVLAGVRLVNDGSIVHNEAAVGLENKG